MVGKTLAQYEVLGKIGQGGMGEVYRARDTKLGRDVALKILPAGFAADDTRRERFLNEARTLATLNHPNIVTIFAVEEAQGLNFLSMELIQGHPLGEEIPAEGIPTERFLDIALPLAEALAAAHDLGVVHRDLKPSNVMLSRDGRIKILDFGLATAARTETRTPSELDATKAATRLQLTAEGVMVGTMPYMSPEQIEGKPLDGRSDLFSLGIMFYEMITGRRPFHGDSAPALMSSILKDVPAPVTHLNPHAEGEVGILIARCLEKDPGRRYQTARDLHTELNGLKRRRLLKTIGAAPAASATPPPAPAVSGSFESDIFISYAQLDNEAQLSGQQGWVSAFHRSLEVRVGQLLGKKPNIWRDTRREEQGADSGPVPSSALLISVLSPRYVKSEICTKELREFLAATSRTGGPKWGARYRVFKVVKTPTPIDRHPPEIQPLTGYEFYKVDPETGRPREFDQIFGPEAQRDYWARLDDLAHDVVELLERVEAGDQPGDARPDSSSTGSSLRGAIYLASTSYDLKAEHDALRRELGRQGYVILPDGPLPLVESEMKAQVQSDLEKALMSIHLVGRNYGVVPEGATASIVEIQNQLAEERAGNHGLNQIVWIPQGIQGADDRQARFLDRLRTNPRLIQGSDLLETPLEDLKTVIHQVLNPPANSPGSSAGVVSEDDNVRRVYLICDQRDQEATAPLADFLFEKGLDVTLPIFEGDEAEVREDHEYNLRLCDAVLVYYGAGNELWLRRKLREVQKSAGLGRNKVMRAKGIWVAPPVTAQKSRLRMHEALVMGGEPEFSPRPLEPFLAALTGAA